MATASIPITYLFVPGDRPDRFDKALSSGADAVILDLEDAVAATGKDAARAAIDAWLGAGAGREAGGRVLIRINDDTTPWHEDDLDLLRHAGASGVMLPKAERPEQIARVAEALRLG